MRRYVAEGNNVDQPGRLIQWLYPRVACYTWLVPGIWYDIGSAESGDAAQLAPAAVPNGDRVLLREAVGDLPLEVVDGEFGVHRGRKHLA